MFLPAGFPGRRKTNPSRLIPANLFPRVASRGPLSGTSFFFFQRYQVRPDDDDTRISHSFCNRGMRVESKTIRCACALRACPGGAPAVSSDTRSATDRLSRVATRGDGASLGSPAFSLASFSAFFRHFRKLMLGYALQTNRGTKQTVQPNEKIGVRSCHMLR